MLYGVPHFVIDTSLQYDDAAFQGSQSDPTLTEVCCFRKN